MKKQFSEKNRTQFLNEFKNEHYDLLIIGGGITGAGAARDAASRGMKVALIEMQDFAEGTSSRSSKLIHGGIRYLENFEFDLVFEALSERAKLFKLAPHLVHPLRFVIPIFKKSRVGFFKMGLGMWLYDALSLFRAPELHERLNAAETMERLPVLKEKELLGSYVYSDAYMDDDRLVIETLRSANDLGAKCVNHVKAIGVTMDDDNKVASVQCKDMISDDEFTISANHVVSSVGPWTDELAHCFFKSWSDIMRPSKGVHLTFKRERMPMQQAVVMGVEERIVFGIPRHEMVIIGTTDTRYSGNLCDVATTRGDVEYLLSVANEYFPNAKLTEDDIIASYSGVRPLVKDESLSEGKTSREHIIISDPRGVTFVAGGKYTTYRHMAKQTIDAAIDQLPADQAIQFLRSHTDQPLSENVSVDAYKASRRSVEQWAAEYKVDESLVLHFVERFGLEAKVILDKYLSRVVNLQNHFEKIWAIEAYHAIDNSMCLNLVDFFLRRTPLFLSMKSHGFAFKATILNIFKEAYGWAETETQAQLKGLEDHLKKEMGWQRQ